MGCISPKIINFDGEKRPLKFDGVFVIARKLRSDRGYAIIGCIVISATVNTEFSSLKFCTEIKIWSWLRQYRMHRHFCHGEFRHPFDTTVNWNLAALWCTRIRHCAKIAWKIQTCFFPVVPPWSGQESTSQRKRRKAKSADGRAHHLHVRNPKYNVFMFLFTSCSSSFATSGPFKNWFILFRRFPVQRISEEKCQKTKDLCCKDCFREGVTKRKRATK